MENDEIPTRELRAEHLEWDATLVRSEEQDMISIRRDRISQVDRVRAVLDHVPDSVFVDAVAER